MLVVRFPFEIFAIISQIFAIISQILSYLDFTFACHYTIAHIDVKKNISALILLRTHGKVKFLEKVVVHNFIVFEIKMLELVPKSFSEPDVILWDFHLAIGSRTGNVCQKAIKTKVGFESD